MTALLERHAQRAWLALFATLLLTLLTVPAWAQQKPGGAEVWGAACGRCHRPRAADAYDARHWETIVTHMSLVARLTPDETEAVREFLVGAARAREERAGEASAVVAELPWIGSTHGGSAGLASDRAAFWTAGAGLDLRHPPSACSPVSGRTAYKLQCVVCHGESGKGNGTVAAAMNPRPSDLTDSVRMARLTDDSLFQILAKGRGAMPGFGTKLKVAQLCEIVAYLRTLKR